MVVVFRILSNIQKGKGLFCGHANKQMADHIEYGTLSIVPRLRSLLRLFLHSMLNVNHRGRHSFPLRYIVSQEGTAHK